MKKNQKTKSSGEIALKFGYKPGFGALVFGALFFDFFYIFFTSLSYPNRPLLDRWYWPRTFYPLGLFPWCPLTLFWRCTLFFPTHIFTSSFDTTRASRMIYHSLLLHIPRVSSLMYMALSIFFPFPFVYIFLSHPSLCTLSG